MSFFKKISKIFAQSPTKKKAEENRDNPSELIKESHHNLLSSLEFKKNTDELSIVEMLMLLDKNNSSVKDIYFQGFWEYSYEINPQETFQHLLKQGYFIISASLEDTLSKMTVPELKEILKSNNLKITGKKDLLIERILNEIPLESKQSIPLIEMYTLSKKAKEILDKNKHIRYFNKVSPTDISIYQYHDFMKENHELEPFEGLIKCLENVSDKHVASNDWGLYRNTLHEISNVYSKEGNTSEALKYIILVCYLDINGLTNNFNLDSYKMLYDYNSDDYFKPYDSNLATIAPGILSKLSKYKTKLNLTNSELENAIDEVILLIDLPIQNFPKDKATKVILAELTNDVELLEEYYDEIEDYVINNYFKN